MSEPSTGTAEREERNHQVEYSSDGRRYYHHGRSPAAWVGSMAALIAFVVAFFGFVPAFNLTVLIISVVIAVVGLIAAVVLRAVGLGQGSRRRR
ncbi:HGxxPAAW family protein [Naumannella halotolerans]|uniref:Uncharacterized protein n=1 Tax=Naumannella halotolerans TaxID=993414 RepID=A0A4R7J8G1_9ACTN|nr:HGxxPAAW family protein [Naumannella halotolerans]TDT33564.1 hypothetical protein CLV29_1186 [Naumannella halotolerans]